MRSLSRKFSVASAVESPSVNTLRVKSAFILPSTSGSTRHPFCNKSSIGTFPEIKTRASLGARERQFAEERFLNLLAKRRILYYGLQITICGICKQPTKQAPVVPINKSLSKLGQGRYWNLAMKSCRRLSSATAYSASTRNDLISAVATSTSSTGIRGLKRPPQRVCVRVRARRISSMLSERTQNPIRMGR